jgi:hypothetical protein
MVGKLVALAETLVVVKAVQWGEKTVVESAEKLAVEMADMKAGWLVVR